MNPNSQKVYKSLTGGSHTPYMEVTHGHRMGETRSGFVVLLSEDGKVLVRIRPGDDWYEAVTKDEVFARTSEYRHIIKMLNGFSRTLKSCGYVVGKINTRTLVVENPS